MEEWRSGLFTARVGFAVGLLWVCFLRCPINAAHVAALAGSDVAQSSSRRSNPRTRSRAGVPFRVFHPSVAVSSASEGNGRACLLGDMASSCLSAR